MAAATGYGDAPTADDLAAYDQLLGLRHTRHMAEVFAVRLPHAAGLRRPPPCGTISFCGGNHCNDVIYSRSRTDDSTYPPPCDTHGNIMLTGPSFATSAYAPIIFTLCLHDGSQEEDNNENEVEVIYNTCNGLFNNYNSTIIETVNTGYGPAEVSYAVLTNAVEGQVTVKLVRRDEHNDPTAITGVLGRIITRSKLLNVGCVLFYSDFGSIPHIGSDGLIPLARRALAVPAMMPLDLRSSSGDEIVRAAVEFDPTTSDQHVERVIGMGGHEIQVTISWLDFPW
ncbi:60 kDa jasmonate-induced protein [Oryza sativa Japonica Group]|uniref:60 kDa jasmonate-induced protein n=1 Tax=Oryza sativa subsp. japonica TaxID=39947 RepID=UPI00077546FF|nr:60 kDa jasmonate-induced protein [Oryza sativa Japonica Group]